MYTVMKRLQYIMSSIETLWTKITDEIKSNENDKFAKMFMSSITPSSLEGDHFVMEAVNDFCRDYVEKRYSKLICRILSNQQPALKYRLITRTGKMGQLVAGSKIMQPVLPIMVTETVSDKAAKPVPGKYDGMFNSKYTFDSFVVGKSNQFAYAVCQSVTRNPGNLHNPVFIYGGVGLGKTHLMQAIGQELIKINPKTRIAYLSSETFTNEFIDSLKDKKAESFRAKYRKIDLLLIDDVQFFAGKEQTQEEFFHTFNELFQQRKQIVLTSDSPPDKIQKLEERLASRCAMGVVVDVQQPDLEMRAAILKKFASKSMVEVPDDVIMYLAQGVVSHVRALEGAFNSVLAFAGIMGKPISKDLVDQVLKDLLRENSGGKISIPWIQKRVAEFYDIGEDELTGKRRSQNVVLPRQVAMRLCQMFTEASLNQIGDKFGGRDHTTVMHACDKVNRKLKQEKDFCEEFERVKRFVDPDKQ
ncbi:MAG: chromosomal replication initiator protein DnaA [Candidatus Riflebacteria bacterium HGW-Riflebacteria-1]|nr:MAG: chromosomal replication initiator protein DnaA [Candidatus Riflebacteria bacterium HGW-Riflebacteria-1]